MYRLIRFLGDSVEKPIYFLFFGGGVQGVVVSHLSTIFFEEIDVCTDVGPVDVS